MIESITAKTGKSIKIFDKQTQSFKSTYEVLKELGSVWVNKLFTKIYKYL